jgi:hypothetical protein
LAYAASGRASKSKTGEQIIRGGRRQTMSFTVTYCTVTTNSITIAFSDAVDTSAASTGAANRSNYTIYDPAAGFSVPTHPDPTWQVASLDPQTILISLPAGTAFNPGDFVLVGISNIASVSVPGTLVDPASIARQVPGKGQVGRITRDIEDAISYPVLTEEIGYRSSPVGIPTGGGTSGSGIGGLGQVAAKAVSEVLGWKPNATDPKGFVGALTQAFTLTDVEGHVESTWTPRTYAVQTDLGGGITGAQASLYMRAKNALDSALPLLDGLYPLDPEADPEYVKALREMARSQMTEIVKELGTVGLPSILRIDTYFGILLGQNPAQISPSASVQFDPDGIAGTLGELRDTYGIAFAGNKFNNSVEDEQDITNFRVISDYMTSLMQSWIANRNFFRLGGNTPAFFGTQLVLISRQLTTIAETINEVRFALDSVFIGPNERQTLLLKFSDPTLAPMFLEDVLNEVEKFAGDEGPRLLRDGGKISVTNNILPVVTTLQNMVEQAHLPLNINELPDGFKTNRVRNSLDDLQDQLAALVNLIQQVEQEVPPAEDKVTISGITQPHKHGEVWTFSIFGKGFDPEAAVVIYSSIASGIPTPITFYSAQRIDVSVDAITWTKLTVGNHDIMVTSSGQSATLHNAFAITDPAGNATVNLQATPAVSVASRSAKSATARRVTIGTSRVVRSVSAPAASNAAPFFDANAAALKQLQKNQHELAQKVDRIMDAIEAKAKDNKSRHKNE